MSKRNLSTNFYVSHKRIRLKSTQMENDILPQNIPTDTESALQYLKSVFPSQAFEEKLPPVLLVHQIYSIIKCKTTVDKDIRALQSKGIIRLFKLGGEETALVVIYTEDLKQHVLKHCDSKHVNIFVNNVFHNEEDVVIDKSVLRAKYNFTENNISELMNCGLLALRSVSSFWFSFPNAGEFMKTYLKGRKSVLRTIKKSKFSEILQIELEQRKLDKSAKLGMKYHIHDIIGAELVQCVDTTSGTLLRIKKKTEKK